MSRTKVLRYCLVGMMAVIAVRLFVVQIVEHEMWVTKADEQHTMRNKIVAKRGEIYVMDGTEPTALVMNESVWTVLVDPKEANEKKTKKIIEYLHFLKNGIGSEYFFFYLRIFQSFRN